MNRDLEKYAKINYFSTIRRDMKYLKPSVGFLLVLLLTQIEAKETLQKTDPEVIAQCDKNRDNKITGKIEGLCYLDLKKKRLDKDIKKLDKDIKKLDKDNKKLEETIINKFN